MPKPTWWQSGVVYQIYPRSFQDSNADGVGDLPGIISRLDYLKWLGITAVWISPIYPSPMADFGYDVADYTQIDPVFGTLADFDRLVHELHRRELKVILDFVPNHSSDQHPWFLESRASRHNPKRDWYVWHDPRPDGGPPNNWLSEFGGPAWTFDPLTGQYYYHAYLPAQPDLNWRAPEVQRAMHEVMRFWLDRGVDGFRVDAIHMLIEDLSLKDNPLNPAWNPSMSPARRLIRVHTSDRPETQVFIEALRHVLDGYADRVLIGEAYLPIDRLMRYYGRSLNGFHLPFNFHLISAAWNAAEIAALIGRYEKALPHGAWPNWVLGNHDKSRLINRVGGPMQARLAAMLLLTLRGTPTLYCGDELGMADALIPADRIQDPWEKNAPGLGLGRDPARAPMPWSDKPGAGFTDATPWLPFAPDVDSVNVSSQCDQPGSMLGLYRRLLALRRSEPALSIGTYQERYADDTLLMFTRAHESRFWLVALNFSNRRRVLPGIRYPLAIAVSTDPERVAQDVHEPIELRPWEGIAAIYPDGGLAT